MQLNAAETRRIINSEKISKVGPAFNYQRMICREYCEFSDGISGNIEITYFEIGNVSNQGLQYRGLIKPLIVSQNKFGCPRA